MGDVTVADYNVFLCEMGGTCSKHRKIRNAYEISVGEQKGRSPLKVHRHK